MVLPFAATAHQHENNEIAEILHGFGFIQHYLAPALPFEPAGAPLLADVPILPSRGSRIRECARLG
jgi:hypothetical protein